MTLVVQKTVLDDCITCTYLDTTIIDTGLEDCSTTASTSTHTHTSTCTHRSMSTRLLNSITDTRLRVVLHYYSSQKTEQKPQKPMDVFDLGGVN